MSTANRTGAGAAGTPTPTGRTVASPSAADRMAARAERAAQAHVAQFGEPAQAVAFAPGRVNLIGEHTDYNGGLVLPMGIHLGTTASVAARADGLVRIASEQVDAPPVVLSMGDLRSVDGWASYVAGSVAMAVEQGWLPATAGIDVVIGSDVPLGAGLSSSAATECAVLSAVVGLTGGLDDPEEPGRRMAVALAAQRAEHEFVGMPCGIMDQATSMLATDGHALLLDSASLHTRQVPLHLDDLGLSVLLIDTRARHALVDGGYAARRADCEDAARALGVRYLADLGLDDLPRLDPLPDRLARRARHIVTEHARVFAAVIAFEQADVDALTTLFAASHASMRDDFQISCPELDVAVEAATAAGAVAARMTGGGFGGSAVALVRPSTIPAITDAVTTAFAEQGFAAPAFLPVTPSTGARLLRPR